MNNHQMNKKEDQIIEIKTTEKIDSRTIEGKVENGLIIAEMLEEVLAINDINLNQAIPDTSHAADLDNKIGATTIDNKDGVVIIINKDQIIKIEDHYHLMKRNNKLNKLLTLINGSAQTHPKPYLSLKKEMEVGVHLLTP